MSARALFEMMGKTALITGGSRGLGLQIAEGIGEMGAKVVVTSRKQSELDAAVVHLKSRGVDASGISFDLGNSNNVSPMVEEALRRLGHIDILVNNAATTWGAPAEDYPLEAWDKVMNLNVRAAFLVAQAVGRSSMIPRQYGRILNIASVAGLGGNRRGTMKTVAYNSSKAALINLTRTLAGEWGEFGITVNAIAPGFFPTKMTVAIRDVGQAIEESAPLGRIGNDEDLKGAAILFTSDAGRYITGQLLAVDGGLSCLIV